MMTKLTTLTLCACLCGCLSPGRTWVAPDPFLTSDTKRSEYLEDAGLSDPWAWSAGLLHAGPLGILPTGLYLRMPRLIHAEWRGAVNRRK